MTTPSLTDEILNEWSAHADYNIEHTKEIGGYSYQPADATQEFRIKQLIIELRTSRTEAAKLRKALEHIYECRPDFEELSPYYPNHIKWLCKEALSLDPQVSSDPKVSLGSHTKGEEHG